VVKKLERLELVWLRILCKFDGAKFRRSVGRPKVDQETKHLVVQMAGENPSWGLAFGARSKSPTEFSSGTACVQ
jgi:hypothetical protein